MWIWFLDYNVQEILTFFFCYFLPFHLYVDLFFICQNKCNTKSLTLRLRISISMWWEVFSILLYTESVRRGNPVCFCSLSVSQKKTGTFWWGCKLPSLAQSIPRISTYPFSFRFYHFSRAHLGISFFLFKHSWWE